MPFLQASLVIYNVLWVGWLIKRCFMSENIPRNELLMALKINREKNWVLIEGCW